MGFKEYQRIKGLVILRGLKKLRIYGLENLIALPHFALIVLKNKLNGQVLKKDIRRKFGKYCKNHKIPGASDTAIKIVLENKFGAYDSQGSYGDRIWEGIRLK